MRKSKTKRTDVGIKVHSLPTLLAHLQTLTLNTVELATHPGESFESIRCPTRQQQRALDLTGVDPAKMFPARNNSD